MDFLLECIGFPPGFDLAALAEEIRRAGEPVAWRGPTGLHLRYPFPGGVEVRLDREKDQDHDTLWPHYEVARRLRVEVRNLQRLPDSPFDALLQGIANPALPGDPWGEASGGDYPISTFLSDARRLPRELEAGHVLAVSISGFALDVSYVGPDDGVRNPYLAGEQTGTLLLPVEGRDQPGGCMELSLPIRASRHLENPLTHEKIAVIEADAPGRPLDLFVSRWQLDTHALPAPRPGWRIEGAFLFTGRVSGGLPKRA
jgi:hypothetical protein